MSTMPTAISDSAYVPLDLDKLKALRLERGLSLEDAARLAGLQGKQRWYEIESGRKSNITLATLDAIAKALGCSPRELLKE